MKKNLYFILSGLLFLWTGAEARYDPPERFTLFEDKIHTHRLMFRQNFLLDVGFHVNINFSDFLDKIRKIDEREAGKKQLTYVQGVLQDFNKTEQIINGEVSLNIPFPYFRILRAHFLPRIEIDIRLGGLLNVRQRPLKVQEILEYVGNDIHPLIQKTILNCTPHPDPGEDIIKNAIDNGCLSGYEKFVGYYFYPDNPTVPQIFVYGKIENRIGPRFYYIYRKHFKGDLKIYWRGRSDIKIRIADSTLIGKNKALDIPDSIHYSNLALDYRFKYSRAKFSGFLAIEEINLAKLAQKKDLARALYHNPPPLCRGHIQYRHRLSPSFLLRPYLGAHYRKHYSLSDGVYLGTELVYRKNRLNMLRIRSQIDPEHLGFSTSFNFSWLILSGWVKAPIRKRTDTLRLSTIFGANLTVAL